MPASKSPSHRFKFFLSASAGLGCLILVDYSTAYAALRFIPETDSHLQHMVSNVLLIFSLLSLVWNHPVNRIKKVLYKKSNDQASIPVENNKKGSEKKAPQGLSQAWDRIDNERPPSPCPSSKKIEQLMIDHESFVSLLLDSTAEAICGFDLEGSCVFNNRTFLEMIGLDKNSDIVGRKIHELIHYRHSDGSTYPQDECRIFNNLDWQNRKVYFEEEHFFRNDGSCFPAECWVHPMKHDGEIIGGVMNIIDISTRKKVEQEREDLQTSLDQSRKLEGIGKQVYNISHDFNSIMMCVRCYTELVLCEFEKENPKHEYLTNVIEAIERAKALISDMHVFSRPDTARKEPFNIVVVIRDVLRLIQASLPANIKIKESYPDDQYMVYGEQAEIFRVIMNICNNAIQAMTAVGEGVLEIMVEGQDISQEQIKGVNGEINQRYCKIIVADNGCGMNQDTKDKIFEPNFTTRESQGGSGLGLSIVHDIVADHRGHIKVDSIAGSGTSFLLLFPQVEN